MAISIEQAESIGIKALHYIAGNDLLLQYFLNETGLTPDQMKDQAGNVQLWRSSLEFLRQNEAECASFAVNLGLTGPRLDEASYLLDQV